MYIIHSEGAYIVVKGQLIASGSPQQLYNPQCFLQYEDAELPPPEWNVSIVVMFHTTTIVNICIKHVISACLRHTMIFT